MNLNLLINEKIIITFIFIKLFKENKMNMKKSRDR
jgi:hypothetical protein